MEQATEEAWDVEGIVGHRFRDGIHDEYLVKWVGYTSLTWEPVNLLDNCRNLIKEYWTKKVQAQRAKDFGLLRPKPPPDFRVDLPLSRQNDASESASFDRSEALAPWKKEDEMDDDLEPTSFRNMQKPPRHYIRDVPAENRRYNSDVFDISIFDSGPLKPGEIDSRFKIQDVRDGNVYVKNDDGGEEVVSYDLFKELFPEALADFVEIKLLTCM